MKYATMYDGRIWASNEPFEMSDCADALKYAGVSQASYTNGYTRENNMEQQITMMADFGGQIKRIGNQFLLKLGCQEYICQTLADVGKKITAVLTEEYKKKDTPDEES
jgi:hypothetical protein